MTSQETATTTMPEHISASVAFPEVPRVSYAKHPLVEVICQLRFPTILKIDADLPADFQERLRTHFPLLNEEEEVLPIDASPEVLQLLKSRQVRLTRRSWKFMSEEQKWTISLTRDFAALSTEAYTLWGEFRGKLALICRALQEVYSPNFYTRIGLRYRDLIIRSALGLDNVSWSELLKAHIAAELSAAPFASAVRDVAHLVQAEFREERLKLGLRHGTARKEGSSEVAYLIDGDFYNEERTEVSDVLDRLDIFNRMAGRLFRWCITDGLHKAMDPRPIEGISSDVGTPDPGREADARVDLGLSSNPRDHNDKPEVPTDLRSLKLRIACHALVDLMPDAGLGEMANFLAEALEYYRLPPVLPALPSVPSSFPVTLEAPRERPDFFAVEE